MDTVDFKLREGEAHEVIGSGSLRIVQYYSEEPGDLVFSDVLSVAAYTRAMVIEGPLGNIGFSVTREELPGKGAITGVPFRDKEYGVMYSISVTGDLANGVVAGARSIRFQYCAITARLPSRWSGPSEYPIIPSIVIDTKDENGEEMGTRWDRDALTRLGLLLHSMYVNTGHANDLARKAQEPTYTMTYMDLEAAAYLSLMDREVTEMYERRQRERLLREATLVAEAQLQKK